MMLPLPPLPPLPLAAVVAARARGLVPLAAGGLWRLASEWGWRRRGVTSAVVVELAHASSSTSASVQAALLLSLLLVFIVSRQPLSRDR